MNVALKGFVCIQVGLFCYFRYSAGVNQCGKGSVGFIHSKDNSLKVLYQFVKFDTEERY